MFSASWFGYESPKIKATRYRTSAANQFRSIPDNELKESLVSLCRKNRGKKVDICSVSCNHDVFIAAGIADILREKYGEKYVSRIVGFRGPQTFKEHVVNFFTGKVFSYEEN